MVLRQGTDVHILIVEDDERIVSFMKRGLEAEEHDVDIASGKSQTLDLVDACTYDVIILDIFLGPDDGLDICRTLRQQRVESSILLMTAKGTAEIEKTSKSAGADAYLAKPFSFDDLVATISRLGRSCNPSDPLSDVQAQPMYSQENTTGRVYQIRSAASKEHDGI
jgi:DNA-binding response OmpR family regulator